MVTPAIVVRAQRHEMRLGPAIIEQNWVCEFQ
jgi:hypothetical protein